MQLEHSFSVPIGIDEAWGILIDIERIGPCMPGAAIDSVDGDDFTGTVKVKLGPINLTYKGKATFLEKDEAARRVVIDARGRDARGNGTAAAKVTATMHDDGGRATTVKVNTELDITGKPAQFGRGVMVDVGNKLLGQFADELAKTIGAGDHASAAAPAAPAAPAKRTRPKPAKPAATAAEPPAEPVSKAEPPSAPPSAPPSVTEPASAAEPADVTDPESDPTTESDLTTKADVAAAAAVAESIASDRPEGVSMATVNGRAASTSGPERHVEPIDLLHHAGPAVAKRLAPVAVAAVIVLIAVRRHRRG